ncbi:MAG: ATP-binding protein [Acutalibacteraceae bacterium]
MQNYRKRVVDDQLQDKLEATGAILIEGPKWCGKTTTAEQIAKSAVYLSDTAKREQNLLYARLEPSRILDGESPRLIDEWQVAPILWDAIRHRVDHEEGLGKFILTGSAVPVDSSEIEHTGTGRFAWLKMRTMSLWESGDSSGEVSIGALFGGQALRLSDSVRHTLEDMAFLACRGGWPQAVSLGKRKAALEQAFNYYDAVAENDISRADGVARDPDRARRLMRSYARLQGTQATAAVIKADMSANEPVKLSDLTLNAYVKALKKIFVVEDMAAWSPNLRSKVPVRTSDTRYFSDPSIATAALGLGPSALMDELPTFGLMFETLVIRDLRVYAGALQGDVRHYHDKNGLECDAVMRLRDGRYGLVEVKLGGEKLVDEGARVLNALASLIDMKKMKQPSFKMVVTAVGDCAYSREDGVVVCPIGSLKP